MNNRKKLLSILSAILLFILLTTSAFREVPVLAETGTGINSSSPGETASKEEVIYAKLGADGSVKDIYAVNILNVTKSGILRDKGSYTLLKNLTSTEPMDYQDDLVSVAAEAGRFYYQGNMKEKALPWKIGIQYTLDGRPVTSEELSGASGKLMLTIITSGNPAIPQSFYDNYLLQITVTLDSQRCTNLAAEGASTANAGSNKLLTFTVMPGIEGSMTVQADVKDFFMEGIQIAAVPFVMNIKLPDTAQYTQELTQLSDAVSRLSGGIKELSEGLGTMKDGAKPLVDGSHSYQTGIDTLSGSSRDLAEASSRLQAALTTLSSSLEAALAGSDLSGLSQLPSSLAQLSGGLKELSGGLTDLGTGYSAAYTALSASISQIPDQPIPQKELQQLVTKYPADASILTLVEVYTAAQTVKATYQKTAPALEAVSAGLTPVAASIQEIAASLDQIAAGLTESLKNTDLPSALTQLAEGISALEQNYGAFDRGLADYTGGVKKLAASYSELDGGITELYDGISGISDGMKQVNEGALTLNENKKDIPKQISAAVDELLEDYDTSDYIPVSFVAPENEKVSSVQFVLKTEGIDKRKPPAPTPEPSEKETFWDRLLDLFR